MSNPLQIIPVSGMPLVQPGDDLAALVRAALHDSALQLARGDVLVLAQKIVSKAEGRYVRLADIEPGREALELARQADKNPCLVELILRESAEVLRVRPGVIIVEHRRGYIHANAGIDQSNIPTDGAGQQVLLLPADPDASARRLLQQLQSDREPHFAVIINDSAGRAWRNGSIGFALGCAGLAPLHNLVGVPDLFGRELEVTEVAVADELAAAASLVMGQAAEACPLVLVRGARWQASAQDSRPLLRARDIDLFR